MSDIGTIMRSYMDTMYGFRGSVNHRRERGYIKRALMAFFDRNNCMHFSEAIAYADPDSIRHAAELISGYRMKLPIDKPQHKRAAEMAYLSSRDPTPMLKLAQFVNTPESRAPTKRVRRARPIRRAIQPARRPTRRAIQPTRVTVASMRDEVRVLKAAGCDKFSGFSRMTKTQLTTLLANARRNDAA